MTTVHRPLSTVHFIDCGPMRPLLPFKLDAGVLVTLVKTNHGLVMIDSAYGTQDVTNPSRLMRLFLASTRTKLDMDILPLNQVQRLGYAPEDVKHIIQTHMHLDHAGGLPDFPWAKVHIHAAEHAAIHNRRTLFERFCLPEHWAHSPDWVIHSEASEDWFCLPAIPILPDIEPQIMMIHLPGHTKGLCGVVIQREDGWLLLSSDSSYLMTQDNLGYPIIDWLAYPIIGGNIPRLREVIRQHGDQVQMVFGHVFPNIELS